jgi:hypothetical protein
LLIAICFEVNPIRSTALSHFLMIRFTYLYSAIRKMSFSLFTQILWCLSQIPCAIFENTCVEVYIPSVQYLKSILLDYNFLNLVKNLYKDNSAMHWCRPVLQCVTEDKCSVAAFQMSIWIFNTEALIKAPAIEVYK